MWVAIAQMAVGDVAAIPEMLLQQVVGDGDEFSYAVNQQRYVVLDILACLFFAPRRCSRVTATAWVIVRCKWASTVS